MASLVNHIRASVPPSSIATEIVANECEVSVPENLNSIIVNLDDKKLLHKLQTPSGQKRADFVFANDVTGKQRPWNKAHVVVIELKGGKSDLSINPIVEQIEGGTKLAEKLVDDTFKVAFRPVLVYTHDKTNERIHPRDRKRLSRREISFHDQAKNIKTLNSGDYLADALI